MVDTNIVYATDSYVNFLKFLHVLRGMISDDRARTEYKYMEYASMKICYFRVRHVRTYTICQALRQSGFQMPLNRRILLYYEIRVATADKGYCHALELLFINI